MLHDILYQPSQQFGYLLNQRSVQPGKSLEPVQVTSDQIQKQDFGYEYDNGHAYSDHSEHVRLKTSIAENIKAWINSQYVEMGGSKFHHDLCTQ